MSLLLDLLVAYGSSGFAFALGHLVLMVLIGFRMHAIYTEGFALRDWRPLADGAEGVGDRIESMRTLDRFVSECRELGPQGFFVPLTDFSDRLDSIVEGKLSDLYNLINMLLIIGIAGSLFGLFEFAVSGSQELSNLNGSGEADLAKFSLLLSKSMAKAFPVGFIGLVLMLVFQILAARPEGYLRDQVSKAIGNAVEERRRCSRSQAQIVEQASTSIGLAMRPLENLETTLANTIMPVVERFGQEMERSHKFFENQFKDLTGATAKIEAAVKGVEQNVEILREASDQLGQTLSSAPAVIQNTVEIQRQQQEMFQQFEGAVGQAQEHLETATRNLGYQIDQVIETYRKAMAETEHHISSHAKASIDGTTQAFGGALQRLDRLLTNSETLQKESTESVQSSVAALEAQVQQAFQSFLASARTDLDHTLEEVSADVKARTESLSSDLDTSTRSLEGVARAAHGALSNLESLPAEISGSIASAFSEVQGQMVEEARGSLLALNEEFKVQLEKLVEAAVERVEQSQELITALEEKVPELERIMSGFLSNTQITANQLADQVVGKWLEVSEGFSENLIRATESLADMDDLSQRSEKKIIETLDALREQVTQNLSKTWEDFVTRAQQKALVQIENIRDDAVEVREALKEAAGDWHKAAREVARSIEEPVRDTIRGAQQEIAEVLTKLDHALAQRYPSIIEDVERLTSAMSAMVERLEQAGRSFESLGSVRSVFQKADNSLEADSSLHCIAEEEQLGEVKKEHGVGRSSEEQKGDAMYDIPWWRRPLRIPEFFRRSKE